MKQHWLTVGTGKLDERRFWAWVEYCDYGDETLDCFGAMLRKYLRNGEWMAHVSLPEIGQRTYTVTTHLGIEEQGDLPDWALDLLRWSDMYLRRELGCD